MKQCDFMYYHPILNQMINIKMFGVLTQLVLELIVQLLVLITVLVFAVACLVVVVMFLVVVVFLLMVCVADNLAKYL